ncbi:phospholipase-like protein, partial [Tanacetum coccineum]
CFWWWCSCCGGVVVGLWWCCGGGVVLLLWLLFGSGVVLLNMENYEDDPVSLTCRSKLTLIKEIRKKFRNTFREELFRKTCFGWLLDLDDSQENCVLIHFMSCRQVERSPEDTVVVPLTYHVNGHYIEFGREEFCLITGLRFGPEFSDRYEVGPIPFRRLVFDSDKDGGHVNGQMLLDIINGEEFDNLHDEVAVAVCQLAVLHFVLLGRQLAHNIPDWWLRLIDDKNGTWEIYPWVPSPGMGHLIPMVEFAKRLVTKNNLSVTFIIPNDGPLAKSQLAFLDSFPNAINYLLLPTVDFQDLPEDVKIETQICLMEQPGKPPVYPVWPLIQAVSVDSGMDVNGSICLRWLDNQPRGSVLYICFGNGGTLSSDQITELAIGLEMSDQRFIWVVKTPNDQKADVAYFNSSGHNDTFDFLPNGFIERTKDRGLVFPTWAPQAQILSHQSTRGFLTHYGWNSVLEAQRLTMLMLRGCKAQRRQTMLMFRGAKDSEDEPPTKKLKALIQIPTQTPLSSLIPEHVQNPLQQKLSIEQFTDQLFGTTSSSFAPSPPKEPTPPRDPSKGKGVATEEHIKELILHIEEGGSDSKILNVKSFVTPEGALSQEDLMAQLKEMKILADLKTQKEKSEKSLMKVMNPTTINAQTLKLAKYEEKRAKMLDEYNKCIYERVDPLLIIKIHYRVSSSQDATMRITRDHDPLNVMVYKKFRLKTLGFNKKRKRSKLLAEFFVKENIKVDGIKRNLIPPPGVEGRKGLVIKELEEGIFYYDGNFDLVFQRVSEFHLATTVQLARLQGSIIRYTTEAEEVYKLIELERI